MYRVAQTKSLVWHVFHLVTLNDLDHEYGHQRLGMILRSIPDTIHVVVLTYFCLILRCSARQNQICLIVKHFGFDLTCVVIGEP